MNVIETPYLKRFCCVLLISFFYLSSNHATAQKDFSNLVNPFIGTGGHGHTFPGASLPYGMVQLSPDTRIDGSWDGCSGYHYSDNLIYGFSHTHLSGTGVSDYGDIAFLPVADLPLKKLKGKEIDYKNYKLTFDHKNESATAGYYSVTSDNGIKTELTASTRVGFHKYTFPKKGEHAIIIQLDHRDETIESTITSTSSTELVIHRRSTAWAKNQTINAYVVFSCPISGIEIFRDSIGNKHCKYAIVTFKKLGTRPLLVKVGLSTVSTSGAENNLKAELSHWDFEKAKSDAKIAWNNELKKIEVSGGTSDEQIIFYTALYHTMIHPNVAMDVDGSYRGMDNKIHKAENFTYYSVFSLWDTFRATHPLFTIIDRQRTLDFIKTFLAHYQQGGRLPVWELASNETDCMIGYHSVSVILDAYMKGIDAFDHELSLEAMMKSANWNHLGLPAYIDHGFLAVEDEHESVSKTLEYAYDDWCIAKFAEHLNKQEEAAIYYKRAQSWKNLFNPESGFMQARKNGSWLYPFDPSEVNNYYTEANSWQYSFFVPHDIYGLIAAMGGPDKFEKKLDDLFSAPSTTTGRQQADITGLIGQYAHGNEPSHHMAYLYNFIGKPWKTQKIIKKIQKEFYKNDPDGLIGNEDCGQMSAWYVLNAMGFYQVTPGIPYYSIGFPVFPETKIHLENGNTFSIKAENFTELSFINSVNEMNQFNFSHGDITSGNQITLQMNDKMITANPSNAQSSDPFRNYFSTNSDYLRIPNFNVNQQTFYDSLRIELSSPDAYVQIHYTLDGSKPLSSSPLYTKPFYIHKSTTIKAICVFEMEDLLKQNHIPKKNRVLTYPTRYYSNVNSAHYHLIPNKYSISILSNVNPQYTAGGENGIIDGLRGDLNWRKGGWQGYQGQNFEAIVDLKEIRPIGFITSSYLQDTRSWIIFPTTVEYLISDDGEEFVSIGKVNTKYEAKEYTSIIQNYFLNCPKGTQARYIKVIATEYGNLPEWHQGYGGDSFIFIDEIEVK